MFAFTSTSRTNTNYQEMILQASLKMFKQDRFAFFAIKEALKKPFLETFLVDTVASKSSSPKASPFSTDLFLLAAKEIAIKVSKFPTNPMTQTKVAQMLARVR